MAEIIAAGAGPATRISPFAGLATPGRLGHAEGAAGVTLAERNGLALATLIARQGRASALTEAVGLALGVVLPTAPRVAETGGLAAIWSGPGQWLIVADAARAAAIGPAGPSGYPGAALEGILRDAAMDGTGMPLAAVIDQTDARGVLRLSGPRARDTMAKGVSVDLHPRAFPPGSVALTRCALIDIALWQVDDTPTFDIAVARGFARSFWAWLVESGAEFGVAVV